MKAPKKIAEKFKDYMTRNDELNIEGWSFTFSERQRLSAGIDNNKIGGPYTPPSAKTSCGGSAYIMWGDGRISDGNITPEHIEDLDAALKEWKASSFTDAEAAEIPEPQPIPQNLKIKDENVIKLIREDSSYLFDILDYYNKELAKKGYVKTLKASAAAAYRKAAIMNSKGLNVEWDETAMSTWAYINNKYADSYVKRKMAEQKDLGKIIKEIDVNMMREGNKVKARSGEMQLILMPDAFGSFLDQYLMSSNLSGGTVAHNLSLYDVDDFKSKKKVFDEKLNIIVDGLQDYEVTTTPCSSMGIPSSKQYVVADGRLITPSLGLKYAQKLGMPPTSEGSINIDAKQGPFHSIITDVDYGLIIQDVLGMHTQDAKEGRYSLTAYNGLVVEGGQIKGTFEPVNISGNFLDSLNDKETKYAKYREDEVVMRMKGNVIGNE